MPMVTFSADTYVVSGECAACPSVSTCEARDLHLNTLALLCRGLQLLAKASAFMPKCLVLGRNSDWHSAYSVSLPVLRLSMACSAALSNSKLRLLAAAASGRLCLNFASS